MKNELVKWILGFALVSILVFVGCRWVVTVWISHVETKIGMITELSTEQLCVKYNCVPLNFVEIDGEKYQYLTINEVPFADLVVGDRVRITYRGLRLPLPFLTQTVSLEITELHKLE